jgi:hypothetical protein
MVALTLVLSRFAPVSMLGRISVDVTSTLSFTAARWSCKAIAAGGSCARTLTSTAKGAKDSGTSTRTRVAGDAGRRLRILPGAHPGGGSGRGTRNIDHSSASALPADRWRWYLTWMHHDGLRELRHRLNHQFVRASALSGAASGNDDRLLTLMAAQTELQRYRAAPHTS